MIMSIHEDEARGRGHLSVESQCCHGITILYHSSANWFPGNKEKSSAGMIPYPEEI